MQEFVAMLFNIMINRFSEFVRFQVKMTMFAWLLNIRTNVDYVTNTHINIIR